MQTKTKGLSETVIDAQRATGIVDPIELAQVVYDATSPEDLRAFYKTALDSYVRMRLGVERNTVKALGNVTVNDRNRTQSVSNNPSKKVSDIREWWAKILLAVYPYRRRV